MATKKTEPVLPTPDVEEPDFLDVLEQKIAPLLAKALGDSYDRNSFNKWDLAFTTGAWFFLQDAGFHHNGKQLRPTPDFSDGNSMIEVGRIREMSMPYLAGKRVALPIDDDECCRTLGLATIFGRMSLAATLHQHAAGSTSTRARRADVPRAHWTFHAS